MGNVGYPYIPMNDWRDDPLIHWNGTSFTPSISGLISRSGGGVAGNIMMNISRVVLSPMISNQKNHIHYWIPQ